MRAASTGALLLLLAGCDLYLDPTVQAYLAETLPALPEHIVELEVPGLAPSRVVATDSRRVMVWDRSEARDHWQFEPRPEGYDRIRYLSMTEEVLGALFESAPGQPPGAEVRVWDLASRQQVGQATLPGNVMGLEFMGNNTTFFTVGYDPGDAEDPYRLIAHRRSAGQEFLPDEGALGLGRSQRALCACAAEERLAVAFANATASGTVSTYHVPDTGAALALSSNTGETEQVEAMAFSPDCQQLAVHLALHDDVLVYAPTALDDAPLASLEVEGAQGGTLLAFSPDGRWLAVGLTGEHAPLPGNRALIRIFDWQQEAPLLELQDGERLYGLAFEADGRRLVSASTGRWVKFWDLERIRADAGL